LYSNLQSYIADRKPPLGAIRNPYLPINQGLAGDWLMNEGAGNTVADLSGNGNTGTSSGDFSWSSGKYGASTVYGGTNGYLALSKVISPTSLPFTVIAHIKPDLSQSFLIVDSDGSNYYFGFWFFVYTTGIIDCSYGDGGGPESANRQSAKSAASTVASGEDCVIAVVCRGASDFSIYKNGISLTPTYSGTGGAYVAGTTAGTIGRFNSAGSLYYGKGNIDFVYVFNRALSASEIALLSREPFCGYRWPNIIELAAYAAAAEGSSVAKIMQQMNQFNGGQAA